MSPKPESPTVEVPFEVQTIHIERDTWVANPNGSLTMGKLIDSMVDNAMERGELIGKVTIDFTEFSKAFSNPHPKPLPRSKVV